MPATCTRSSACRIRRRPTRSSAHRQKARELHPDANPDDPETGEHFKEVAGRTRCCPTPSSVPATTATAMPASVARAAVVRTPGSAVASATCSMPSAVRRARSAVGGAVEADLRGQDMEVVADLTFEQAVFGAQIPVSLRLPQRCDDCGGSGAGESTKPVTCSECNGTVRCVRCVRASSARWSRRAPASVAAGSAR